MASDDKVAYMHSGFDIGISVILILYSIVTFINGCWGYSLLSDTCINNDLKAALRGMIITGAVSVTLFVGFALCTIKCKKTIDIDDYHMDYHLPVWIPFICLVLAIINVSLQTSIQNKFTDKTCFNADVDTYQKFNSNAVGISIAMIVGIVAYFAFKIYKYKKSRDEMPPSEEDEEVRIVGQNVYKKQLEAKKNKLAEQRKRLVKNKEQRKKDAIEIKDQEEDLEKFEKSVKQEREELEQLEELEKSVKQERENRNRKQEKKNVEENKEKRNRKEELEKSDYEYAKQVEEMENRNRKQEKKNVEENKEKRNRKEEKKENDDIRQKVFADLAARRKGKNNNNDSPPPLDDKYKGKTRIIIDDDKDAFDVLDTSRVINDDKKSKNDWDNWNSNDWNDFDRDNREEKSEIRKRSIGKVKTEDIKVKQEKKEDIKVKPEIKVVKEANQGKMEFRYRN